MRLSRWPPSSYKTSRSDITGSTNKDFTAKISDESDDSQQVLASFVEIIEVFLNIPEVSIRSNELQLRWPSLLGERL